MSDQPHNDPAHKTEDPLDSRLLELVAYLDGELTDLDSARLEKQLVSDAPLRSCADSLDRTWRLLDSLGDTTASGEFTQKTLASIDAVPIEEDGQESFRPARVIHLFAAVPWLKFVLWCFVGFTGSTVGLLLSRSAHSQPAESEDTRILREFDLLLDYQKIRPIPDTEFLRKVANATPSAAESKGPKP